MTNTRLSNFELLRIICMLMIVAGHVVLRHGTTYSLTDSDEIIRLFCMSLFSVAVNTFVLISGYFGIVFKKERFVKLIMQTFFYSVLLLFVSILLGWHTFDIRKDVFAFMPILTKQYWFITCYVILYIISPWLNKWVTTLNKKEYIRFLCLGFVIIYVWPTLSYLINTGQFIGDSGYGIINFGYLYLLGRYLNLHYEDPHSSFFYFGCYLQATLTLFISQYILSWILGFEFISWISYNTLFIFMGAVCLFLSFKNMTFSSRIVNYWAKPCLAVYLIYFNPFIWEGFCKTLGVPNVHGFRYYVLLICLPVLIYFVCAIIEFCRIKLLSNLENKIVAALK